MWRAGVGWAVRSDPPLPWCCCLWGSSYPPLYAIPLNINTIHCRGSAAHTGQMAADMQQRLTLHGIPHTHGVNEYRMRTVRNSGSEGVEGGELFYSWLRSVEHPLQCEEMSKTYNHSSAGELIVNVISGEHLVVKGAASLPHSILS
jgi:hypothetical protein